MFWWKLAFLALIVAAQCALNSSKAQLRFALLFYKLRLFLRRNIFKVARPTMPRCVWLVLAVAADGGRKKLWLVNALGHRGGGSDLGYLLDSDLGQEFPPIDLNPGLALIIDCFYKKTSFSVVLKNRSFFK
jgi:hypothetical protein